MRSLSVRYLLFALLVTPALYAHDVTISGTTSFAALDGSSLDHDGVANGVFTVSDGNLIINGVVNCNDDGGGGDSACNMAFNVSGNVVINSGGALYAENRTGSGTGGNVTLTVGGNLVLNGTAIISTASKSSSGGNGGAITATVAGTVTLAGGTTIDGGSATARGGNVTIVAGGAVSIDGNVLSGPSRTILATRLTDVILDGGTGNQVGGAISIRSSTFSEPGVVVSANANIVSQGDAGGAGPVSIEGCGVEVRGLVAALSRKDSAASVSIRSGKTLLVDGRDLGGSGARMGRVRADSPTGTAANKGVDLFAPGAVSLLGPGGSLFAVTSHPGIHDSKSYGGTIRVYSTDNSVTVSGNAVDSGQSASGDTGGTIDIQSKGDANLNGAVLRAMGDFSTNNSNRGGGDIKVRSYSGSVIWTNGLGDVRPVGSASGLVPADQGTIVLTACGTVNTTGSTFPVMGTATSVFPEVHTGVCSPARPSLPAGSPPFVTCNTPPVANPASATTNEDTAVTVHLSGSDADGDPITFSIVTPPAHGTLGNVVSTGPTTADVVYTPALNYNGSDSFVFEANDGRGGTNDNTATITIVPVNDPPTFQLGANQTVLEDSGPQTVANWVTGISPGPPDEAGQSVTFTTTNNNPSLFSAQPSVAPNGTLTYTPAPNAYGSATITVVAHDNGGTANGGNDTSAPQTSTITVTPVNDPPSFIKGADQVVNEDAGPQSVAGWATSISAGPNEGSQTLTFFTSNNNNALFSAQPAVSPSGTLTYTPAPNANGSATVTIYLKDDGGTANGGVDTSPSQTFTITVNPVNDPPSFTSGGNVTVLEDSGAYSAPWATNISAGPPDESGQTVNFSTSNNNAALFAVAPSVSATGVLTFTPAPNANGSATVTVTLFDNGGTANGGNDTSAPQTFVITVTPVNDPPSFTGGGNVTVNEDSGAYAAAWATSISAGPANESSQTVAFFVSNSNNALFSVQPSVSPSGVLTFTPAANAFGSATVTIYAQDNGGTSNGGVDTSPSQTFLITVNSVNDPPSFTGGGDVTVNEDSGAYSAAWATNISAGPANESSQTVAFFVSNSNNALFSVQPSVSPSGVLTFTPAANAFGSATVTIYAQDNGGTANGGVDTSASQTFTINVTGVNDAPSFTPGANQTSFEDGGPQSVAWATNISAGPGESSQTVTFVVSNDNNGLFSAQPAISPSGVLTYTAAPNMNGSATVTVYLKDDGGTANGGVDQSPSVTFTITVVAVNDAPSFTSGGDVTVLEDSGAYSAAWATNVSPGPADESSQTVNFNVSNNNNALFSVQPSISPSGVLSFTPAPNANGDAVVTVTLHDDGGTANGGVDTSSPVTFTIHITAVNDAPSFTPGGNVAIDENSGAYSAPWATNISAGPANESGQTVHFNVANDNNALFSAQPAISPSGVLTFTSALNAYGSATVTVSLSDNGGTANGGVDTSASVTFTITINRVNQPPVANGDTFSTFGNTELRVDLAAASTPSVVRTTPSGRGVLHNDTDPDGDPLTVTGIVGCGDVTAPFDCTFASGTLSMNANGTFSFKPAPGATSATFQYNVTDQPSFGSPITSTGTVTITITHMIWYVNGSAAAGGDGTSASPFKDFSSLDGAGGVGDVDGANDIIFVHDSTVNSSGLELENGQHFLGEGVGLIVDGYTLVPAGTKPKVFTSGPAAAFIHVAATAEVAGLELHGTDGVLVTNSGVSSGGTINASIHDNVINATQKGIDVLTPGGTGTTVLVNNTSITAVSTGYSVITTTPATVSYTNGTILSTSANGIGFDGSASGGNLTVVAFSNVTVDGATLGDGIDITAATFDSSALPNFQTVNGGTIAVGTSLDPVGGNGIVLTNVKGDFAATSLSAFGTSGLTVTGTGLFTGAAGMRVAVAGGDLSGSSGAGLSVTNATIASTGLNFTSINSTNGVNGIVLNNTDTVGGLTVTGTGSSNSGGTIQNATGDGIALTQTKGVSFTDMRVLTSGQSHINATNVNGLTLTRVSTDLSTSDGIRGNTVRNLVINGGVFDRGGAGSGSSGVNGVTITNLLGSSSVTGATFRRSNTIQFRVNNSTATNAAPGAPDVLTFSGTTFDTHTSAFAGDHLSVNSTGGGNLRLVTNSSSGTNSFTGAGNAIQATADSGGTLDLSATAVSSTGNVSAFNVGGSNNGKVTFSIVNNATIVNAGAIGINVTSVSGAVVSGTISGNTITNALSTGIQAIEEGNGSIVVAIANNTVIGTFNTFGIRAQARLGTGLLSANVTGNNVSGTNPSALNAISIESGASGSGHTNTVCLNMANNSAALTNGGAGYRLRQRVGTIFNLQDFTGNGTSATDVATWINVTKANIGTTSVTIGSSFSAASGACQTP